MGRLTPEAARARSRKVVVVNDSDYEIRKLAADEMIALGFFPEGVLDGTTTDESAAIREVCGPETPAKVSRIIAAATINPPIFNGAREACPDDGRTIWIGDLADDRDGLFKAIYQHSKLSEVVSAAARFRDRGGLGGDAVDAGGSGEAPAVGDPREPVAP